MAITGRTALAAAVIAVTAPLGWGWLLLAGGLLLAAVAVDVALAARVAGLAVSRAGRGATLRLGEQADIQLMITNNGQRHARGLLRDAWLPSAGAGPRVHRIDVPAGERRRLVTTLRPTRRGDRTAAHLTIRTFGPLGLAGRQRRRSLPGTVRVLPPFTSRKFLPEKLAKLRELDGSVMLNRRGQGTEFDSLREYVDGDDVRSIDWRATARRADVVVRTWRPERDRRLVCVLDTGRTSAARVGDIPRLDAALDACLLLAAVAAKAGDRVDLLAADSVVRASVEGATRNEVLPKLVRATALLEPALVESDAQLVVTEVLRRERKRALVVLFTSLDPAPIEHGLLPVLNGLTARHTVVLAAVGDPRVAELAGRRGDAEAVYEAASAERTLADRRRVTAQLRQRGVKVIDAPADLFASRVADAYLGLKAAGQL
jgi:uncharacterized protein (DUF58 family)